MRGKVLFCYARRGEQPSCRRAAEKHDELAPKDLAVPRASNATPCAIAKTSTLRPGGESKSGLNDDQAPSPRCVYRKSKSERIDDEVRPVWRANL
jgi:hypothetical protein